MRRWINRWNADRGVAERAAWARCLFTLPWDIARQNISFEGGIRLYEDADVNRAVRGYNQRTLPGLARAVEILDPPPAADAKPVLRDQRDRYHGLLLLATTVRNLFVAQTAINACLLEQETEAQHRRRLQHAIEDRNPMRDARESPS